MDPNQIIIEPVTTEAALDLIETENKLVFYVSRKANKNTIKWAIQELFDVEVVKVNTIITPDGRKKAFVKFAPDYSAAETATQLGIF